MIPKERSLISVLLLTLVTCGIYYLFWVYETARDMDELLGESDIPPAVHVLLFLITGTLWGYAFDVLTARKIARLQAKFGLPIQDNTLLYLIFDILGAGPVAGLGLVTILLEQGALNDIYRAAGGRLTPIGSGY